VISGQLPNGLRYYLKPNLKPAGYVELRLALKAGSLQETRRQRGLAHFVEHMAFNGTRHFPKNELIHYLESTGVRFGADLNAYTSFGETVYQLQVHKDSTHLHRGLLVLEDWATGIRFEPAEVEKERGVIMAEWRNRQGPNQRLEDQYLSLLYRGSRRLRRLPIGDTAIIQHASAATLQQYYQKWYRPDLMAIVAVGDFDPQALEQEIIRRFGRIPARKGPAPGEYSNRVNPQRRGKIYTDAEAAFCQAFLYLREPGKHQAPMLPRTYGEMQDVLTRNLYNSMLNRRLIRVQQQSDPPFTFAGLGFGADWGQNPMFSLSTFTSEQKLRSALTQLWLEVQKARHHQFTPGELLRQKQELLNTLLQQANAQETTHSANWANQLSTCFIEGQPFSSAQQRYVFAQKLLNRIGMPQLVAMMQGIPQSKNRRVLLLSGPEKNRAQLPPLAAVWRLLDSIEQLPVQAFTPSAEDQLAEQAWVDTPLATQAIVEEKYQEEFAVHEFRLRNGVRVLAKPTRLRRDQVLLLASSPGGHSWVPDSLFVNATYLSDLMQQAGMGKFDYVHYQEKLTGKSVTLAPYLSELEEGFSGSCRSTELEDLLALIYLYAVQPRFDTASVLSFRKRQENVLRNMLSTPYYQFAELKQRVKYGPTPRRGLNRLEDLPQLNSSHLRRIHQERFGDLSDLLVVIVGDFDLDQLKELAQRYLGNLPAAGRHESWKDLGLDIRKGQIDSVSQGGRAPKTLVEYTWHGDFVNSTQERYQFSSMIAALQIRLREVLREQEGGIYSLSFSGNVEYHPRPVYRITLGFNTDPPRANELMAKALACIENFCQNGPDQTLLNKVKNTQKENRMKGEQDNGFWLNQLHQRYKEGWSLEGLRIQNYFKLVDGLSAAALQGAAQRYLQGRDRVRLVLVPE
jgi:zinc protease